MCWRPQCFFARCGHRFTIESVELRLCNGARARGRPCVGSLQLQAPRFDTEVIDDICPDCKYIARAIHGHPVPEPKSRSSFKRWLAKRNKR
ncbi:hypothetical protein F4809DRAFT_646821 [Biscogniauxia mediterranea]|nr:hypothetical protein F4809DRAFT_646821 [Biscogniauxia mediterranea]